MRATGVPAGRPLSIAVVYDPARDGDRPDVNSIVEAVDCVGSALGALGHHVERIPVTGGISAFVGRIETLDPDVVFNLCEGYRGDSVGEASVASLLDLLGVRYTGSGPLALSIARDKPLAKRLFAAADIPTPAFAVYSPRGRSDVRPPGAFPVILKLAREDASVGLTPANVVYDAEAFFRRVRELFAEFEAPVMAEAFIDGREFTVPLLDGEPVAIEEIEFAVEPRIVCYRSKWRPCSAEYLGTTPRFDPLLEDFERTRILGLAERVYDLLGFDDYGRVDFRLDALGRPYVLEANPNPDITPGSGFRLALEHAAIPFDCFLSRVLDNALTRTRE